MGKYFFKERIGTRMEAKWGIAGLKSREFVVVTENVYCAPDDAVEYFLICPCYNVYKAPYYLIKIEEVYGAIIGRMLSKVAATFFRDIFLLEVREALGDKEPVAVYICWRDKMWFLQSIEGDSTIDRLLND